MRARVWLRQSLANTRVECTPKNSTKPAIKYIIATVNSSCERAGAR